MVETIDPTEAYCPEPEEALRSINQRKKSAVLSGAEEGFRSIIRSWGRHSEVLIEEGN